jgi:outer membrane protein TolC
MRSRSSFRGTEIKPKTTGINWNQAKNGWNQQAKNNWNQLESSQKRLESSQKRLESSQKRLESLESKHPLSTQNRGVEGL